MESISCLILLGPAGDSPAERWVFEGQAAACRDLVQRLAAVPQFGRITLMSPHLDWIPEISGREIERIPTESDGFQFGKTLVEWAERQEAGPLAYFGGCSAPLLDVNDIIRIVSEFSAEKGPIVFTNNRFSSDWAFFPGIQGGREFLLSLETDNPMGWGLEHQVGWHVRGLPANSTSRTDIDTPWDLLMLHGHYKLGDYLAAWLSKADDDLLERLDRIRTLLKTPAKTLMVIGRSSSAAWSQLESRTQVWTRLVVEERGMLASGRFRRGEVKSLLTDYVELVGLSHFINQIGHLADGLLWDSRVWLAAGGGWPSRAERFAADLGWSEGVKDDRLRELLSVTDGASIPIISGGHGVVAGGLMAMLDTLD